MQGPFAFAVILPLLALLTAPAGCSPAPRAHAEPNRVGTARAPVPTAVPTSAADATERGGGLRQVFARRFGGAGFQPGNQLVDVQVATDPAGNTWLAGSFEGSLDLGAGVLTSAGGTDIYLAKLDATGATVLSRRFGSAERDVISGLAVDGAGNAVIAGVAFARIDFGAADGSAVGTFPSAIVLAKLAPDGSLVWQRELGKAGQIQFAYALAADAAGHVFLSGRSELPIDFGPITLPTRDTPFIVKLGPDATPLWGKAFAGGSDQAVTALRADSAGHLSFTGDHEGTKLDDVALPRQGQTNLHAGRLGRDGELRWMKSFGDGELSRAEIATTPTDLFFGGPLAGTVDFGAGPVSARADAGQSFLVRLGPMGQLRWQRVLRGHGKLATDAADTLVMAGTFTGSVDLGSGARPSAGGKDGFVARFSARTGLLRHAITFGDAAEQSVAALAVERGGAIVVAGTLGGTIDLGAGPLRAGGPRDLWVAKLAP